MASAAFVDISAVVLALAALCRQRGVAPLLTAGLGLGIAGLMASPRADSAGEANYVLCGYGRVQYSASFPNGDGWPSTLPIVLLGLAALLGLVRIAIDQSKGSTASQ